jgi:oligopeptide/dipeptide ABC transporter ATP-binding protein
MPEAILDIRGLTTAFIAGRELARAVDDVSLALGQGETLALVGESGSGKTVLALSVMRLVQDPPGRIMSGQIVYRGQDLLALPERRMRAIRGNRISMIFQEPMTSLNPVFRVGDQIAEVFRLHQRMSKAEALDMAADMLAQVNIPDPRARLGSYPHELSGGMRQRVVIAIALALGPDIVLADEPTTALDVTVQAQILDLMLRLKADKGSSILLITHDMGVVAQTSQRVAVMYAGRIVEEADVCRLFREPLHPYTKGLLESIPKIRGTRKKLAAVEGMVPGLLSLPGGCRFHPRCPEAMDRCRQAEPPLAREGGRSVRCWLHDRP